MTAPSMEVTRCVCADVTFEQLKLHVDCHQCDYIDLCETFGCASHCGLCRPYIFRMLETGETRFALRSPMRGPRPRQTMT